MRILVRGHRWRPDTDGPFERILKERLVEAFRDEAAVSRAYLARADLGDGSGIHVVLGLRLNALKTRVNALLAGGEESEERRLAGKAGSTFASIFGAKENLDLLFISAPQEARLRKVCEPFFERD
jgi:hypothetical protein